MRQLISADTRRRLPAFALALLNVLLLPHSAHADVGDAMEFVGDLLGVVSLVWLVPTLFAIRRYGLEPQLLGLFIGGATGFAICTLAFFITFGSVYMIAGFFAAAFIGGFTAERTARAWHNHCLRKAAAKG